MRRILTSLAAFALLAAAPAAADAAVTATITSGAGVATITLANPGPGVLDAAGVGITGDITLDGSQTYRLCPLRRPCRTVAYAPITVVGSALTARWPTSAGYQVACSAPGYPALPVVCAGSLWDGYQVGITLRFRADGLPHTLRVALPDGQVVTRQV